MKNSETSVKIFFATILVVALGACLFFASLSVSADNKAKTNGEKGLIELKRENGNIILISRFHLIPPGSTKIREKVPYKKIGKLNIKADKDLVKDAKVSIDFFEKKLKEKLSEEERQQIELKEAYFDIYRDFVGKYTTDMVYAVYEVKKQK